MSSDEIEKLRAENERLRAALRRLASNEGMKWACAMHGMLGEELAARIDYARAALAQK